jgi:hypothetical protein
LIKAIKELPAMFKTGFLGCILLCFLGCIHGPVHYPAGDYVVVEATEGDTLAGLAARYLNDPDKAWMISEFNKTSTLVIGKKIIIPLKPFNLGGLRPDGYQLVPVLCYASVTGQPVSETVDTPSGFERQMDFLKKNNYQVISFSRFMGFLAYRDQIPEKSVIITLDDNSLSVVDKALPRLEKYGFQATLFVDPAILGKKACLTLEDLKLLKAKGMDIQCRSGWNLDSEIETQQISLKDYFLSMKQALVTAKKVLGPVSECACDYYALPLTGPNNLLIELLRKEGFKAALTLNDQANPFYVDHYDVGRISVSPDLSADKFKEKLNVFRWVEMN